MEFWINILNVLNTQMETPALYGWYHLIWLAIIIGLTVFLCTRCREASPENIRRVVFWTAVAVALLEIYKQINYTFRVVDGSLTVDYQWYAFPFQFCSTPMYVGLLAGIFRKGKIHDALCAYLASYSVFAGLCVMIYPGDVFCTTAGINFQTMVCHGSMIVIGVWLLATGYVKPNVKSLRSAAVVFASAVCLAAVMNEIAYLTGLLKTEIFNMFFISPHCDPSLPVYSLVQKAVDYPWSLIIYIAAFTAAAGIILLAAAPVRKLAERKTMVAA